MKSRGAQFFREKVPMQIKLIFPIRESTTVDVLDYLAYLGDSQYYLVASTS